MATTSGASTCPGTKLLFKITVNPKPDIKEAFTATICSDSGFTTTPSNSAQNSIPAGTTYSWGAPTVTGGVTGGDAGANQTSVTGTLTNPTNVPQTATYTVTPWANGCSGTTFTLAVTINPKPFIKPQNPIICSGDIFTVNPTDGTGNIVPMGTTYSWTVASNTNVTGQSDSSLATN
jgi:hypothetical protein